MKFLTIEQIRAHSFVGNHHNDSEAFKAIDAFAANTANTIAHRAEAIRIVSTKGMGFTPESDSDLLLGDKELVKLFEETR